MSFGDRKKLGDLTGKMSASLINTARQVLVWSGKGLRRLHNNIPMPGGNGTMEATATETQEGPTEADNVINEALEGLELLDLPDLVKIKARLDDLITSRKTEAISAFVQRMKSEAEAGGLDFAEIISSGLQGE